MGEPLPLEAIRLVHDEIQRTAHRAVSPDPLRRVSIVAEEAGELLKAANDFTREPRDLSRLSEDEVKMHDDMIVECIHTAASAIRLLDVLRKESLYIEEQRKKAEQIIDEATPPNTWATPAPRCIKMDYVGSKLVQCDLEPHHSGPHRYPVVEGPSLDSPLPLQRQPDPLDRQQEEAGFTPRMQVRPTSSTFQEVEWVAATQAGLLDWAKRNHIITTGIRTRKYRAKLDPATAHFDHPWQETHTIEAVGLGTIGFADRALPTSEQVEEINSRG